MIHSTQELFELLRVDFSDLKKSLTSQVEEEIGQIRLEAKTTLNEHYIYLNQHANDNFTILQKAQGMLEAVEVKLEEAAALAKKEQV